MCVCMRACVVRVSARTRARANPRHVFPCVLKPRGNGEQILEENSSASHPTASTLRMISGTVANARGAVAGVASEAVRVAGNDRSAKAQVVQKKGQQAAGVGEAANLQVQS